MSINIIIIVPLCVFEIHKLIKRNKNEWYLHNKIQFIYSEINAETGFQKI